MGSGSVRGCVRGCVPAPGRTRGLSKRMRAVRTRRRRSGRRAFTLIELLIVIAILLAIGGLVVVNLIPKKGEADINLTRVQIDQFESAIKFFKLAMNRYPNEDEGLRALWSYDAIEDEQEQQRWTGPYLETPTPRDIWGTEWEYHEPSEELESLPYDIISWGPDKEEDTEDDITNHDRLRDEEGELPDDLDFAPVEP